MRVIFYFYDFWYCVLLLTNTYRIIIIIWRLLSITHSLMVHILLIIIMCNCFHVHNILNNRITALIILIKIIANPKIFEHVMLWTTWVSLTSWTCSSQMHVLALVQESWWNRFMNRSISLRVARCTPIV